MLYTNEKKEEKLAFILVLFIYYSPAALVQSSGVCRPSPTTFSRAIPLMHLLPFYLKSVRNSLNPNRVF